MIVINKASANTIVVTVTEKVTLTAPYYFLFVFTNDLSKEDKVCISANTSTATERYDKFVITEQSATPNNLIGQITLTNTGFWKYKIYAQSSSTNIDPDDADELVEVGKCRVEGTQTTDIIYEGQQSTYNVYQ